MKKKTVVVVCSHGMLAEEFIRSAQMIIGPMPDAVACCLLPGMQPNDYLALVEEKIKPYENASLLVLADLFGGTPCNTMARLLKVYDMHIVTGISLGMLIEVYSMHEQKCLQELRDIAMQTAEMSCVDVNERLGIIRR